GARSRSPRSARAACPHGPTFLACESVRGPREAVEPDELRLAHGDPRAKYMSEVGPGIADRAFHLPVVVEALLVAAPLEATEPRTRLVVEMFGECQLEVQRGAHDLRIGILVKPSKKRLPTSRRDGVRDLIANSFGAGLDEDRLREFGELAIHMAAIQVP